MAESRRRGLLLVLAVVLLLRVPFLNQAVQGDDPTYLAEAAHALVEPFHPMHVSYVFQGESVDLRGHPHPPLNALALAALLAVFGDVKEVPFHAAYIVFSLVAAWATWKLACRFSPRPVWAALLFLAVPAFVVNGNSFEADLPFLACWMAALALFTAEGGALSLAGSAVCMVLAALAAYQAVFLTPILAVYVWLRHRRNRLRWGVILIPVITLAAWQLFERSTTGAAPAGVLSGYFSTYALQAAARKLSNALMLFIHGWFIVFPALVPPAFLLAWRKRREPDTLFLLAWIGIFFAGAVVVFFAGAARYLLPMAAPVALLTSRLRPKWLAVGFAAQLALALGLAVVNYQHWDGYRQFATQIHGARVWIDGEWGLRHYLEIRGALPLTKTQRLRAGDVVASSELGHSVEVMAPSVELRRAGIQPALPLRLIGLESHSGYSTVDKGFWPFGISTGPVDRLTARAIRERRPTLEYLSLDSPAAKEQIVSGVSPDRWMSRTALIALKNPSAPARIRVTIYLPPNAPARRLTLMLDGREVAARNLPGPGAYEIDSPQPVRGDGESAMLQIDVDRTFTAPGDRRDLGVVLIAAGFIPAP